MSLRGLSLACMTSRLRWKDNTINLTASQPSGPRRRHAPTRGGGAVSRHSHSFPGVPVSFLRWLQARGKA